MSHERTVVTADHPTFTLTKLMRPTASNRLTLSTVVTVDGVELTISDLRVMLLESVRFDEEWRGEAGLGGLKRLGSV